jgi:dephospho-CoA kinase
VYNADEAARKFLNSRAVAGPLESLFGKEVFDPEGKPNRKKIASIVFNDRDRLNQLNALIHPLVRQDFDAWLQEHSTSPYAIQEAAILFETGHYKHFDKTILVTAPRQVRIDRVCRRDGISVSEVEKRMQNQSDQEKLEELADFTIYNDGKLLVIPQILRIHEQLAGTIL